MIDKKIPYFNQTYREFFTKKTNYIGLALVALGTWISVKGGIWVEIGGIVIMNGLAYIGVRDAQTKTPKA